VTCSPHPGARAGAPHSLTGQLVPMCSNPAILRVSCSLPWNANAEVRAGQPRNLRQEIDDLPGQPVAGVVVQFEPDGLRKFRRRSITIRQAGQVGVSPTGVISFPDTRIPQSVTTRLSVPKGGSRSERWVRCWFASKFIVSMLTLVSA